MDENIKPVFDEIFGLDIISFSIGDEQIFGYLSTSPLEQRVLTKFNYQFVYTNVAKKSYKAHWAIFDSELLLMYVNGIINGVRLYTNDFVPEYPDDVVFFCYHWFSGQLKIDIQQTRTNPIFKPYCISENELLITFEKGILVNH